MTLVPINIAGGVQRNVSRSHVPLNKMWSVANARLKPGDSIQLHEDVTRNTFAAAPTGQTIIGVFYLSWEGVADQIGILTNSAASGLNIYTSPVGSTGTWTQRVYFGDETPHTTFGATKVWVVHRGNEYFIGTDIGNWVLREDPTNDHFMGMFASNFDSALAPTLGGANVGSAAVIGDIFVYVNTEYDNEFDIESVYGTKNIAKIRITTTGEVINNVYGGQALINQRQGGATGVQIYRQFIGNGAADSEIDRRATKIVGGSLVFDGGRLSPYSLAAETVAVTDNLTDKTDSFVRIKRLYSVQNSSNSAFDVAVQPRDFDMGVLFHDCMVLTDVDTSSQILRFSPPGQPEYQPDHYFMYFATERSDAIVGLRTVNDKLIVLLGTSVQRINYLPLEGNVRADSGRIQETVTSRDGCVGRQAHTTVETRAGELVVWLSPAGLRWTDGQGLEDACPDFTIAGAGIAASDLATALLVNDPANYRLRLFIGSALWDFYYQEQQLLGSKMKCLGPSTGVASLIGKTYGPVSNVETVFLATASTVYIEQEPVAASTATIDTSYITGHEPVNQIGISRAGMSHTGGSPVITVQAFGRIYNEDEIESNVKTLSDVAVEGMSLDDFEASIVGERIRAQATVTDTTFSVGPLWVDADERKGPRGR